MTPTSEPTINIVPVSMGKFVPPWISDLPIETTVTDDYTIEIGITEQPLSDESISPGTDVKVIRHDNGVAVKPMEAVEREKAEKQQRRELAKKARERARHREERLQNEERAEFWDQYNIPIEFAVEVNIRKGEMGKASTGTGRTEHTVQHFVPREDFSDGRLQRSSGEFLCKNSGDWTDTVGRANRFATMSPADETTPKVTCSTCLKRMERWRKED